MLGLLWSCTYDFSIHPGIWSNTGSFWKRFDQECQYQSQHRFNISESCKTHIWDANQKCFIMWGLFEAVHTISPCVKVLDPKLDHSEHNVIKSVNISQLQCNISETCKTDLWVENQKYFIMLGLLWSCTYDFSMFQGIWSKTGSFRTQCDQECQYQSQPKYNISETCKTHLWVAN